jgi:hypothetical protein
MTVVATQAEIKFGAGGVIRVTPFIRLTGNTDMYCFTYDDHAPVLVINDGHVSVSVSVPDVAQVTGEDVQRGRALAGLVVQYVTALEHRVATQDGADEAA